MLEKIICVDNIGVLRHGAPKAIDLGRATLVYAENGRGKSTIAAILSSLGNGDTVPLVARQTFGGGPQKVHIRGTSTSGSASALFSGGQWSSHFPEILVFDQQFIERNVYAGSEVHASHHEALLEFALGTAAVKKKQELDKAGEDQLAATKRRTAAEDKLKGFTGKLSYATFERLSLVEDVDEKIVDLERQISAARDASSISIRRPLSELDVPSIDFSEVREILAQSLKGVHEHAAGVVQDHANHLNWRAQQPLLGEAEEWLASGFRYLAGNQCPFCAQTTDGSALIAAYQSYFDEAYTAFMERIDELQEIATDALDPGGISGFEHTDAANRERINVWTPQLTLILDELNIEAIRARTTAAKAEVDEIVRRKSQSPLVALPDGELASIEAMLNAAFAVFDEYNKQVREANELIAAYQSTLASASVGDLQDKLATVQASKTRFLPEVTALVDERLQADADRAMAEATKKAAREELDQLMSIVLGGFESEINLWLAKFGADFTVVKLKPTYQGNTGAPRTEYGLSLRGTTVIAGKKSTAPSFHTALSDGDKRTLALAFFLARLFSDSAPTSRIVVLDDMFTSLDKHRRAQTVETIAHIVRSVAQVVVLAHDAYFLRDVNRRIASKGICTPVVLEVARAADGYSELRAGFDLDEICATDFYKHYRALNDFLEGTPSESAVSTAKGLRPLLEGHLHRRFPGRISEGLTVGSVLATIKSEPASSPLSVLQPSLANLHDLNDFASAFHHDTSGLTPRSEVTDTELRAYGKRMMQFLHTGNL